MSKLMDKKQKAKAVATPPDRLSKSKASREKIKVQVPKDALAVSKEKVKEYVPKESSREKVKD